MVENICFEPTIKQWLSTLALLIVPLLFNVPNDLKECASRVGFLCLFSHRNIGDIAVKDILPAKVEFVMTLLNNSDSIRHDLDHMMYHMGNMITLKQSVIDSVSAYIEQNRNFIQNLIGREFQFDTFFR